MRGTTHQILTPNVPTMPVRFRFAAALALLSAFSPIAAQATQPRTVRPGAVSHVHTSMSSIQKTIYELLGLGPLNLQDALSADLSDVFAAQPDLRPYRARPADARVFVPGKARGAHPRTAAEAARLLDCDDPEDLRMQHRHAEGKKQGRQRKPAVTKDHS